MLQQKKYLIDHRILFVFGVVFYLIVPCWIGMTDLFTGLPGMELYRNFFKKIPGEQLRLYFIIVFSWVIAFFLGHFSFRLLNFKSRPLHLFPAAKVDWGIPYFGYVLLFVMLVFIYLARNSIFGGYATYDIAARGKMSTLLVVLNFFMIYQLVSTKKLSWTIIAGIAITCFILLSMGGRMYVFQTMVVLLIFKTSFAKKRWDIHHIVLLLLVGFLLGSFSGIWRLRASYNIERAMYSFAAEPVFTWISTSTFLIANKIPLINFPLNFLTSFFNLVPNTVISLSPYVVSAQRMGFDYMSPLGADSVWTTYIINFGAIGSVLFIFLLGFMLNFLKYLSGKSRFAAVYYIMVCGILPFQFFRDAFYIINKQLFFNFLFLPAVILLLLRLILYFNQPVKTISKAAYQ